MKEWIWRFGPEILSVLSAIVAYYLDGSPVEILLVFLVSVLGFNLVFGLVNNGEK